MVGNAIHNSRFLYHLHKKYDYIVKQNTGNCYSNVNSVTSVKNGNLI